MEIRTSSSEISLNTNLPALSLRLSSRKATSSKKTLTPISKTRHSRPLLKKKTLASTKILPSSSKKPKFLTSISLTNLCPKPFVSADCWITLETFSAKELDGKNQDIQREIASLSKIMTLITVIQEINRKKRSFEEVVTISLKASSIEGTSADLKFGDEVKVWDLLHGLMLPSGNDAAIALAEFVGGMINKNADPISCFVDKMNANAKALKLNDTFFNNPHGMSISVNLSTARDVAILASYAIKMSTFRQVVNTKKHICNIYNPNGIRKVEWINTNALLDKGFKGVKTGITPAAGPCLCFFAEKKKKSMVGVLLNSRSMDVRWCEAVKLWRYSINYLL
ncbi:hypothetical protein SteCoe_6761 [Stentor coeruleus]|uniref:Peptidase S11 D-alanyl-D-alanine carboxypeptidase A N-terminal domain-containing protein n=1 Tax=Stentor coeruleus TaxID=5963 RepID=A0A1R2CP69_9CILI|nr:hypothetical protein SteCoe_6761 [Stentor coeruleus]